MGRSTKILVYPGWQNSPYLKELYKGAADIIYAQYGGAFFPISRNAVKSGARIIHIHWTSSLFANSEPQGLKSWLKRKLALIDIFLTKFILRKKLIWTIHNLYPHECANPTAEKKCRIYLGKISDRVIVLGQSAVELVSKEFQIPKDKITVQLHGTLNSLFDQFKPSNKESIRTRYDLALSSKLYLLPGSVKKYKNPLGAIEAFNQWDSDAVLIIAGQIDSSLKSQLKECSNVKIIDRYLEDEELFQIYSIADWVIFPYTKILTSGSLLTAMGLSKAIIAPNMGTIPDYLDENGGILYDTDSENGLLKALELSKEMDPLVMGRYNSEKALNFDWDQIRRDQEDLIKKLVNE